MAFDAHKNFAVSAVATAPSPASSGTSLVVTAGEGTRFPAVPFNATICPASVLPTPANAEVVRVTAISTDTLTITRAQESSSARTVVVTDLIYAAVTAKTITDIEPVYCRVYHNAAQTLTTGVNTVLAFNSEREDSHGTHDTATNNSRLTPPAGVYVVAANIAFAASAVGRRQVDLLLNATTSIALNAHSAASTNVTAVSTVSPPYRFNGTDYVQVRALHSSTTDLDVPSSGNYSPEFGLHRVGI